MMKNMSDNRSKTSAVNGAKGGRPKVLTPIEQLFPDETLTPVEGDARLFNTSKGRLINIKKGAIRLVDKGSE